MSERFVVQIDADQFDRLAKPAQPMSGIAELIPVAADPADESVDELVALYRAVAGEHHYWDEFRRDRWRRSACSSITPTAWYRPSALTPSSRAAERLRPRERLRTSEGAVTPTPAVQSTFCSVWPSGGSTFDRSRRTQGPSGPRSQTVGSPFGLVWRRCWIPQA